MIILLKVITLYFLLTNYGTTTNKAKLLKKETERIVSDKDAVVGVV